MELKIMYKAWRKLLLFLFILCRPIIDLYAQTDLPNLIKPSPETSALFRFQDYPMDYSTGLPEINIPIYEIQSGSLSLPISISHHASGRRVYDKDGAIAVGWSLNAGGVISRVIHGAPDFGTVVTGTYDFPYPFKVENLTNLDDISYLQKISRLSNGDCGNVPYMDAEYDIFSYSFGGHSGKFFYKDENNVKTPVWLPYKPFLINTDYTSTGINQIEITDDKGILYVFNQGEQYSTATNNATSSWTLRRIISADKQDSIILIYGSGIERRYTIDRKAVLKDSWNMGSETFPLDYLEYESVESIEDYAVSRISEIRFRNGKLKFNLVSGTLKLDNIQILNNTDEVIKTFEFDRSLCYSQAEIVNAVFKLDKLRIKDKNNNVTETYSFDYYPFISSNGQLNVRYRDWWGYYNNSQEFEMIPNYSNLPFAGSSGGPGTINIGNPSANREPSLEPLKSGVLKKITYPTGGNTEFIYELNKCKLNGVIGDERYGPGLRIYQIKTSDGTPNVHTRTFKYGIDESGFGSIDLLPDITSMASELTIAFMQGASSPGEWTPGRVGRYRERTFYSDFISDLNELSERPVIYTEVVEYLGTETENIGKTKYNYDYSYWAASGMPTSISLTIPRRHIFNYNYWNTPTLIQKEEYRRSGSTYQLVKSTSNLYSTTVTEEIKALHVQRLVSVPQTGTKGTYPPGSAVMVNVCSEKFAVYSPVMNPIASITYPGVIYAFNHYQIRAGYKNLVTSTETLQGDNGQPLSIVTSYQYNDKQLLTKRTTTTSENTSNVIDIKYPTDYTGNATLTQMTNLNMINFPVENTEQENSIHKKSIRTSYFNWGTTPARIAPEIVEQKIGNANYETRTRFYNYDIKGNPTSFSKESDLKHSYLWDYSYSYPVAQAINAENTDIAYTSFEADGKGNWNNYTGIINTVSSAPFPPTGKKYYNLTPSATLSRSVTSGKTYIISYWRNNASSYLITGGTSVQYRAGKTVGNWTYHEHKITATTTTLTISGTGGIDEVRLYPIEARMSTYTYEPLIGMTSQCDINNRITYYEYDSFGRLSLVRDQDRNILKKVCYNTAGQPENCPPYGNAHQTQSLRKNNCTGCQFGSWVTYNVPEGTYISGESQADADQQALNDIAANSQAYANTHGTCGPPPNAGANAVNGISSNVYIIFTNNCTNTDYSYTLNANSTQSFGPFPEGTYTVYMSSSGTYTYIVNGYSQTSSSPVSFFNITISGAASVQVTN